LQERGILYALISWLTPVELMFMLN
jgi:hypothetical protein